MPNCKSFFVTEAERKYVKRCVISTTSRRELPTSFFSPARQGAEENSRHSDRNIRGICTHRQNWVVKFKRGDFSTCDAPRPGRPSKVTTPVVID